MLLRHRVPFAGGYTPIVERQGPAAEMLMDFGVLTLKPGEVVIDGPEAANAPARHRSPGFGTADERAYLLTRGTCTLTWDGGKARIARTSLFDESPWCLHVPAGCGVTLEAGDNGAELCLMATDNPQAFSPRLYTPQEARSEARGAGTMNETSTRVVRTVFDNAVAPYSNLVVGEVITLPGKWSSYPPHHHPQPEIYHYRFLPGQGFGLCALGDSGVLLRHRDTLLIREGEVHPHTAAPGYAMWYLWVIRHVEGDRYITPTFVDEHRWVMSTGAEIWSPKT